MQVLKHKQKQSNSQDCRKLITKTIMAAIPAIALAVQHATGVPVSGCQLRRNLVVTRTPKTSITATKSNPAVQYEAGVLVSTPCQLRRNWASGKREKTIVAAFPVTVEFATGVPIHTNCELKNSSDQRLKLNAVNFWEGQPNSDVRNEIVASQKIEFRHQADAVGSVGGLEYKFGENLSWIIAWSNSKNDVNKVYAEIHDENSIANWALIKAELDKSKAKFDTEPHPSGYMSHVEIHPTNPAPTMTATLTPLPTATTTAPITAPEPPQQT